MCAMATSVGRYPSRNDDTQTTAQHNDKRQVDFAKIGIDSQVIYHQAQQIIRDFFLEQGVAEVTTPIMMDERLQETAITNFVFPAANRDKGELFLQASPELSMKQMLAKEHKDIFQMSKVFRRDEQGALHNHEFSMLEWYRIGFNLVQIKRELLYLLGELIMSLDFGGTKQRPSFLIVQHLTYAEIFQAQGISLSLTKEQIYDLALRKNLIDEDNEIKALAYDELLDLLFSKLITELPRTYLLSNKLESDGNTNEFIADEIMEMDYVSGEVKFHPAEKSIETIANNEDANADIITMVEDFPIGQAGFTQIGPSHKHSIPPNDQTEQVAYRFELIWHGIEIANGGLEASPDDIYLPSNILGETSEAMQANITLVKQRWQNLPQCCGVALGLDRLLMLISD